jgi:beta-galactosidase
VHVHVSKNDQSEKCRALKLDAQGIIIDGRPTILFCSSLFYFRIPRGLWLDRMRAIRASGYNCIDTYFPWNHHELAPG